MADSAESASSQSGDKPRGKGVGKDERRWYDLDRTAFRVEALPKMRGLQQSTVDTVMRDPG